MTPSPIARTSGFQPASRSGIRTRIARTSDRPSATSERRPRQPATPIVTSANSSASPPMSGRRQRSTTENVVVPSCCVSMATTTSSPTAYAGSSSCPDGPSRSADSCSPRRGPSRNSTVAVGASWSVTGGSATIRAWIRSDTRPLASGGARSGRTTRIAATARRPSANRTISRSDRRRRGFGTGSGERAAAGRGSAIIGASLPSAGSRPADRSVDRTTVLVHDRWVKRPRGVAGQSIRNLRSRDAPGDPKHCRPIRASRAGWPNGTAPDQMVRATPRTNRRNHAFPIHDPFDLGSCRVDPPDAPADQRGGRRQCRPHLLLDERVPELPRARRRDPPRDVPDLWLHPPGELTPGHAGGHARPDMTDIHSGRPVNTR